MSYLKGSRKFLIGLLLTAIAVGIEIFSKNGLSVAMSEFLLYIGSAYFIGNIGEHVADKLGKSKGRPPGSVNLAPITTEIEQLRAELMATQQVTAQNAELFTQTAQGIQKQLNFVITKAGFDASQVG